MAENLNQEDLIATLQRLGLELQNPAAIPTWEDEPIFTLIGEDEDRPAFSHVLFYDTEMIEEDDAYTRWVLDWARATAKQDRVTDVASHIDFDGGTSWLTYTLDGRPVRLEFKQDDDWLDPDVHDRVLEDFGTVPGRTRLYIDNGQGGTYIWLPDDSVAEFTELFPDAVRV
ncbi:hypothetical protein ACFORJ_01115 [Corynebacterium hansenii]|uniref:Uncharacterized protein n=1 Tax=Corynebacterium hansenii TaxID=394964 RepID=A0ABV7ZKV1_9CORY|nr:hypothetical protein [Corynebacterium hansenii]WJY99396.1 hypothetical protein CHAN_03865 [Corynebacterium hansenii]